MNEIYRWPTRGGPKIDLTLMARLWNDNGLSASEIAAHIGGISRAAVLGHVHRHKDMFKSRAKKPQYKRTGGVRPTVREVPADPETRGMKIKNIHKARMEAARREAGEFADGTAELLKIAPSDAERLATGKELMDLGLHQCRWPLNNGYPFLFCADATDGAVYCAHHAKRSYQPRVGT